MFEKSGVHGNALLLNGTDQYDSLLESIVYDAAGFSISAWFNFAVAPTGGAFKIILSEGNTGDVDQLLRIGIVEVGGNVRLAFRMRNTAGTLANGNGNTNLLINTNYHVAVIDNTTTVKVYLNGVLDIDIARTAGSPTGLNRMLIGARQNGGTVDAFWNGWIDDVRIHNTTLLTAAAVALIADPALNYMDGVTQGTWGIISDNFSSPSSSHPDTLYAAAKIYLQGLQDPPSAYRIHTIDLSKEQSGAFGSFEFISIGSVVRIIDQDFDIETEQVVVRKVTNLHNPMGVEYEIESRLKLLSQTLSAVFDQQQFDQNAGVTRIGASQVIVLGDFTVADWVTGGTTTISGNNITTGTITADKLNVNQLSAITAQTGTLIVDEVIKSGAAITGYDNGVGFWLEYNGGSPRFFIGNSAGNKLLWDGTNLTLVGGITATGSLDTAGINVGVVPGVISSGATGFEQGTGFWLDYNGGSPQFYFGAEDGPEKLSNGSFTGGGSWNLGTWAVTGNELVATAEASGTDVFQDVGGGLVNGTSYVVRFEITSYTAGGVRVSLGGGTPSDVFNEVGTYTLTLVAGSPNDRFNFEAVGVTTLAIDNASLKLDEGSYVSWNGEALTIRGKLRADHIEAGTLIVDRMPILTQADRFGHTVGYQGSGQTTPEDVVVVPGTGTGTWNRKDIPFRRDIGDGITDVTVRYRIAWQALKAVGTGETNDDNVFQYQIHIRNADTDTAINIFVATQRELVYAGGPSHVNAGDIFYTPSSNGWNIITLNMAALPAPAPGNYLISMFLRRSAIQEGGSVGDDHHNASMRCYGTFLALQSTERKST
jgi:hypothetical protein